MKKTKRKAGGEIPLTWSPDPADHWEPSNDWEPISVDWALSVEPWEPLDMGEPWEPSNDWGDIDLGDWEPVDLITWEPIPPGG